MIITRARPVRPAYQAILAVMANRDTTAIEDQLARKAFLFRSIDQSKLDVVDVHQDPKAIPVDPAVPAVPANEADLVNQAEMEIQVTADRPVQPDQRDQRQIITVVLAIKDHLAMMTEMKYEAALDPSAHKDQLVPPVRPVPQVPMVVIIIIRATQAKPVQQATQATMEHPALPDTEVNPVHPAVIVNIVRALVIITQKRRRPKKLKQKLNC